MHPSVVPASFRIAAAPKLAMGGLGRRSISNIVPPQIVSKSQICRVAKEKYTATIEKDLIQIYEDVPKGPAGVRMPTGPVDYYINRYTTEAPGTMLVHAAFLVLVAGYIENRIFNEEHSKLNFEFH